MNQKKIIKQAFINGFPAFLKPIHLSNYDNSSPYLMDLEGLMELWQNDENRIYFLKNFNSLISYFRKNIGRPVAAMIGGSFLQHSKTTPSDIDVLLFYDRSADAPELHDNSFNETFVQAEKLGIDLQMFPFDHDPVYTLKVCSFYTNIFSSTKQSGKPDGKGLVMIDLKKYK